MTQHGKDERVGRRVDGERLIGGPSKRSAHRRRLRRLGALAMAGALIMSAARAQASVFEGVIASLRFSQDHNATARVGIEVAPHGSPCLATGWFGFDGTNAALSRVFTAAVMMAHASGKLVHIEGSGTCDQYGVEGVNYIDVR